VNKKLLVPFGLKYNPFGLNLPTDGLLTTPRLANFFWRVSNALLREGGFAMILGESGSGKSKALQLLVEHLSNQEEIVFGVLSRPQSRLGDFYRELGELFGVDIRPHNRWGGFKMLRQTWQEHLDTRCIRPILLIDEAQEMSPDVLSELRVLASTRLDAKVILSVVLAGDARFLDLLRLPELVPLAGRIRFRLTLEPSNRDELRDYLLHLISQAGNAHLVTPELILTLADHAHGNLRVLVNMGNELLTEAMHKGVTVLDEKLFLQLYDPTRARPAHTQKAARNTAR
jgi:type II secretory pathway predicted ATPase ExeA